MDNERALIPIREFGVPDAPAVVELRIEELVLHGFSPGDRFRISDAVEREMTRLIAEHGVFGIASKSSAIDWLDAGRFKVASNFGLQTVGAQIGQALYQSFSSTRNAARVQSKTRGIRK